MKIRFLTQDELRELTGFCHSKQQAAELNRMGITHKIRSDGRVMVSTDHVQDQFGGGSASYAKPAPQPNLSGLNA